MRRAVLDTTILTNILLKPQAEGKVARAAIKQFGETLLPQYAIKEFKAGPLRAYVWFHNKVVTCSTWSDAVAAIPTLFMQRNKQSTAFAAVHQFQSGIGKRLPEDFTQKYPGQSFDLVQRQEAALWLKYRIAIAWKNRTKVATKVIAPLSCYKETDLKLTASGPIDDTPVVCSVPDCCLRYEFTSAPEKTSALLAACANLPSKIETDRRRKALRDLDRHPDKELSEKACKALGDAVFALQCPKDAVILTTNIADHQPLAAALGVGAVPP